MPAQVVNNFHSPIRVSDNASVLMSQVNHVPPSAARQLNPGAADSSIFGSLAEQFRPSRPADSGKVPTTVEGLQAVLSDWIDNDSAFGNDVSKYRAMAAFCQTTVGFARRFGTNRAWLYFLECQRACALGRYNPTTHGDRHMAAYTMHFTKTVEEFSRKPPFRRDAGDKEPSKQPGTKRTRPTESAGVSSAPNDPCRIPGHLSHTNADCNTQKRQKRGAATAPPSAPAASA